MDFYYAEGDAIILNKQYPDALSVAMDFKRDHPDIDKTIAAMSLRRAEMIRVEYGETTDVNGCVDVFTNMLGLMKFRVLEKIKRHVVDRRVSFMQESTPRAYGVNLDGFTRSVSLALLSFAGRCKRANEGAQLVDTSKFPTHVMNSIRMFITAKSIDGEIRHLDDVGLLHCFCRTITGFVDETNAMPDRRGNVTTCALVKINVIATVIKDGYLKKIKRRTKCIGAIYSLIPVNHSLDCVEIQHQEEHGPVFTPGPYNTVFVYTATWRTWAGSPSTRPTRRSIR